MGSYAECWIGSFFIGSTKNDVDSGLMNLFRSIDKKIITDKKSKLPNQLSQWMEDIEEDADISVVYYSAPVAVIRDRLNLQGYTFETAKLAFNRILDRKILEYKDRSKQKYGEFYLRDLQILQSMNVDLWLLNLRRIYENGLKKKVDIDPSNNNRTIIDYMLEQENAWYGFPGYDLNVVLRLAVEALPESEYFVYDVTDLVLQEYFDAEDDFVEIVQNYSSSDYYSQGKIIILTEGRSDAWILSDSMKLLYPHLVDYYTFMNFDTAKVGGGVGNLANITKAFSGAGIINKVLAVFDNDTAAKASIRDLKRASIPKNIKILQLPDFEFLNEYPTLGPSGLICMNINGMAGSIELYLGSDVLKDKNGEFIRIQWTGYDSGVGKYQGEILNKDKIHTNFKVKLEACKSDTRLIDLQDWVGIKVILESIFSAFNQTDGEEIISWADRSCLC